MLTYLEANALIAAGEKWLEINRAHVANLGDATPEEVMWTIRDTERGIASLRREFGITLDVLTEDDVVNATWEATKAALDALTSDEAHGFGLPCCGADPVHWVLCPERPDSTDPMTMAKAAAWSESELRVMDGNR